MKKKYIEIESDWVNTIILPLGEAKEHLKTYYWGCLEDWLKNEEQVTLRVVEMTEKEYLELPEWRL